MNTDYDGNQTEQPHRAHPWRCHLNFRFRQSL